MVEFNDRRPQQHSSSIVEDSWGCKKAVCNCGWESAPTNTPHTLTRTVRSHRLAAEKAEAKRQAKEAKQ